ncbi:MULTISPECIES: TerC family protein [unclassified Sphingobium]|uniref:TerC family protein n=1 Tax=unclassified Sphingobium TaxID=2611147 RepID=UPI00222523C0|nr:MULTISPECIES: TerC family protein [unclassified Sphingobium]MCW2394938.1 tellurite resistance protein TerC [Sphingobium sp. B8D3B]MCW2418452.1 tellurite resistance protein TerC [Sphingobium sp. B8D3C]
MEFLDILWLGKPAWMWLMFMGLVLALLVFDLGVLHKEEKEIGVRESLAMSAFYITLGLAFGGWIWWQLGPTAGLNYVTGFVVEKSLAMDNVFVIAMIFTYFGIPRLYQHRVLFWGILGVIVLRALMIGFGAAAVQRWDWVLYVFAAFLIFTGIKMWRNAEAEYEVGKSPVLRWIKRRFRVTEELHGNHFWVKLPDGATGRTVRYMTPLFLALLMVEFVDVVFAVDSVPAIFAITTDPFIVYTSNIFAILGLRALYFALAAMVHRFHYLKYALSLLLVFIGSKIVLADALGIAKIPPVVSLSVTFVILAGGVFYSLWKTRGEPVVLPPAEANNV